MTDIIEAIHVSPIKTADVFIVMKRYGADYWGATVTCPSLAEAQRFMGVGEAVTAWKIVKVSGLLVEVPPGEAVTANPEP